jgi:uncharacterized repeat protein (TIGR02543 family)
MAKSYYTVTGTSVVWDDNTFTLVIRHRAQPGGAGPYTWYFNYTKGSYRDRDDEETYTAYSFPYSSTRKVSTGSKVYWGSFGIFASSGTLQYVTDYTITVASGGNGKVKGGGTFRSGTSCKITATANLHYKFSHWSDGNTSATRTITVNSDIYLTAYFTRSHWVVKTTQGADGNAYVGSSGTSREAAVAVNGSVTIRAIPDTNFKLVSWAITAGSGPSAPSTATATYTPTADVTLMATFTRDKWLAQALVNDAAGGSAVITTNGATSGYFQNGASVTFTATPKAGYYFAWWSLWIFGTGDAGAVYTATFTQTMPSADFAAMAWFYLDRYQITVSVTGSTFGDANAEINGTPTKDGYVYPGNTVVLKAIPENTTSVVGAFLGWYVDGEIVSTSATYMPPVYTGHTLQAYEARFAEAVAYTVTAIAADATAVSMGCAVAITTPANSSDKYYQGHVVTVQASPASGYEVARWDMTIGAAPAGNQTSIERGTAPSAATLAAWGLPSDWKFGNNLAFALQDNTTVTATFDVKTYVVTFAKDSGTPVANQVDAWVGTTESEANSMTTPFASGTGVSYGWYVRLEATASGGDAFRGWYKNGVLASTESTMTVQITDVTAFVAKFGNTVAVSAADDKGTATVEGAASYGFTYGDEVTIKATPVEGFYFASWTKDGVVQNGWSAEYSFIPTGATTLVANFTSTEAPIYLKLSNGSNSGFGELTLAVPSGFTATPMTKSEWESAVEQAHAPAISDPLVTLGDTSAGADSYWEISGQCDVTVNCEVLVANATFTKWTASYFKTYKTIIIDPKNPVLVFGYDTPIDSGTTQHAVISVTNHCKITAGYYMPGPKQVLLYYATGCDYMGVIEGSPRTLNYTAGPPITFDVNEGDAFTAIALAANGYKFDGWYSGAAAAAGQLVSTEAQFTQTMDTITTPSVNTLYAKFSQDTDAVYEWEGSAVNKMMTWRSKRYVSTRPVNMSSARLYADGYPVTLVVYKSSSPDAPMNDANVAGIIIGNQDARRLPMRRPEKYIEIEVRGNKPITDVAVSTAMEGLL